MRKLCCSSCLPARNGKWTHSQTDIWVSLSNIHMLVHCLANRIAPRIISKISMRYSFIALDLDGTTLNSQHELSAKTESVLRRLSGQGVTICIATGRTTRNITRYVTQLALPQDTLPVICFNGSYGFTYCRTMTSTSSSSSAGFVQSSTVFGEPLQLELTKVLLEFAERQGCVAQVAQLYIVSISNKFLSKMLSSTIMVQRETSLPFPKQRSIWLC